MVALVVGAAVWPAPLEEPKLPPIKVKKIGPNAFETDALKLRPAKDGYAGSSLVVFTYNTSQPPNCDACARLDEVTDSLKFQRKHAWWQHKKLLKAGKVLCNGKSANKALCERFSAVVGAGVDVPRKVDAVSSKVFIQGSRRMQPSKDGYAGNVLLLFTQQSSAATPSVPCENLDALITSESFERRVAAWRERNLVRIGKVRVEPLPDTCCGRFPPPATSTPPPQPRDHLARQVYCNKQPELCERFGVTGSRGDEPGLPHVVWFQGGQEQGEYDGGHSSLDEFDKWVFEHSLPHVLWFKHGAEAVAYDGSTSSVDDFHKWVVAKQDVAEL